MNILKVAIGYYTFNEFCDAIVGEVSKVVDVGGLTYKDEYVGINTMNTAEEWWFDRESVNTTINGCNWVGWFKLSGVKNLVLKDQMNQWMVQMDMHFLKILIWNMIGS